MGKVRGCNPPEELLYDVQNRIWYRELDGGDVRFGMTTVAPAMAGRLAAFPFKAVGQEVKAGKSCAIVESGNRLGPAKLACGGTVAAVNEAPVGAPVLADEDPDGKGSLLVIRPVDWGAVRSTLVAAAALAGRYEAKMTADGFAGCGG